MSEEGAVHVDWEQGGQACILSAGADAIRLRSTVPSPPGSRIAGALRGEAPARLWVKIHGCKRQADGRFLLEGRPLDLTKEVRTRIEQLLQG